MRAGRIASLLGEDRGARARWVALVAAVGGVAFWLADSAVDALLSGETFAREILHPSWPEVWTRLLVTTLIVLLLLHGQQRARLHLLSSVVAAAPDGIQIAGLGGEIAYSNRAVEALYGFSPEEFQGKHVDELNADPRFASRVILPALERHGRWEGEIEVKHKTGATFPIWLTTSVLSNRRGRPIAAVGIIRDISDRKRSEEALRRYARQLEELAGLKELFADILRHDLMGPASALRGSIDLLLRQEPETSASRKLLQAARRSCTNLTDMIESAARYAKLSAPQEIEFATLDLAEVLRDVVVDLEVARQERGARIALDLPGPRPTRANPMIAEVFANLLSNALKYGPVNGTVVVEVGDLGDRWRVSVADSGEGIPDSDKKRIFTRFERLRKEGVKGTGLGLAIARRIVELHGGAIWVEDNPTGGSIFCVALPKA